MVAGSGLGVHVAGRVVMVRLKYCEMWCVDNYVRKVKKTNLKKGNHSWYDYNKMCKGPIHVLAQCNVHLPAKMK